MARLFGEDINKATVLDVIRMSAGIPDFEFGTFDDDILENAGWVDYPFESLHYVGLKTNMTCAPGSCGEYISTSYEVAGLILAAVLSPDAPWYGMDLGDAALPSRQRYPSLV